MQNQLERLVDYFRTLNTAADFSPTAVPTDLLPIVYVLDIEASPELLRLKIRLTGTALDIAFGRSVTGKYLEEFMHGPRGADVLAGFRQCAKAKNAIWMRQTVRIKDNLPRYVEGVAFYVVPDRIYGGLIVGELHSQVSDNSFELIEL